MTSRALFSGDATEWQESVSTALTRAGWAVLARPEHPHRWEAIVSFVPDLPSCAMGNIDVDRWRISLRKGLAPTLDGIDLALPHFLSQRNGSIVVVLPDAAFLPRAGACEATALAGAAVGLVRSLSAELGPSGIRVNGVTFGGNGNRAEVGEAVRLLLDHGRYVSGEILRPGGS